MYLCIYIYIYIYIDIYSNIKKLYKQSYAISYNFNHALRIQKLFYLKHLFLIYTLVAYGYQIDIAWLNLI